VPVCSSGNARRQPGGESGIILRPDADRCSVRLEADLRGYAEEAMMKRLVYGGIVVLLLSGLLVAQGRGGRGAGAAEPQQNVQMTTAPEIPFDSVPDFFR